MNHVNIDNFIETRNNAEHFSEVLNEKRAEIRDLQLEIADEENDLRELNKKMATASRNMAIGRLSTDAFQDLKREIGIKEEKIAGLKDALAAQNGAIQFITDDLKSNRSQNAATSREIAKELAEQLASEIGNLAGEKIRGLLNCVIVSRGSRPNFTLSERQREREAVYLAIGEVLCKGINQPSFHQARQHIDEIMEWKSRAIEAQFKS